MRPILVPIFVLSVSAVGRSQAPFEVFVYRSDFDALSVSPTQNPPHPGQDGWYAELAVPPGYGEIQGSVAVSGSALHEFTGIASPNGLQTIDRRPLTPPNLAAYPIISLSAAVRCRTSDVNAINTYAAGLRVTGGPHPGFLIIGFGMTAGNGASKAGGINLNIDRWDPPSCNGGPIPLNVGQGLTWDSWHRVHLIADQASGRYISVSVDGQTQDLSAFELPQSSIPPCGTRGQLMESLSAEIIRALPAGVQTAGKRRRGGARGGQIAGAGTERASA